MIELTALVSYTDNLLSAHKFDDYCPNGLQVEGKAQVSKIIAGVTASQQLIDIAIEREADLILVHHGYFWRGEALPIVGMKKRRLQALLKNNISLLAYHLPLDTHEQWGNNIQLAKQLHWSVDQVKPKGGKIPLVRTATLERPWSGQEMSDHVGSVLHREPLHIKAERKIKKIAWCTGAAQSYLSEAIELGADAYLTGEVSESTVHEARESGIHFFAAGHHATERYGVCALGEVLAGQFGVECQFVDCDNPA